METIKQQLSQQLWKVTNKDNTYIFTREYKPNYPYEIEVEDRDSTFRVTSPLLDDGYSYTVELPHKCDVLERYLDNVISSLD